MTTRKSDISLPSIQRSENDSYDIVVVAPTSKIKTFPVLRPLCLLVLNTNYAVSLHDLSIHS